MKHDKLKVYIVNDKVKLNIVYRSFLMKHIDEKGFGIETLGVYETPIMTLRVLILIIFRAKFMISSNLRSNLLFLMFFWTKGCIILNGLGRFKRKKLFIKIVGMLLKVNFRKTIFIQNYGDFRYYRRFYASKVIWVPGSGGVRRNKGKKAGYFIISREEKFRFQSASLRNAFDALDINDKVTILGMNRLTKDQHSDIISLHGFVPQSDIFNYGDKLIQPRGYGEGIPHCVVDALCSDIAVFLEKRDFISFGLYTIGFEFFEVDCGWGLCRLTDLEAAKVIEAQLVCEQMTSNFIKEISFQTP